MRWAVRHETIYRYSVPVAFAPHVLRLCPRPDAGRLLARTLAVEPAPSESTRVEDAFGNVTERVAFGSDRASALRIESRFEVETCEVSLGSPEVGRLPWAAGAAEWTPFLANPDAGPEVEDFARTIARDVDHAPLAFLELLCGRLYARTDRHIRLDGAAQPPAETLSKARGACRDIAVLFLAACRTLGIPGRFVSGYQARAETPDGKRHLHAWPEVLLPGIGWRGWDPTHGVRVSGGHVALCAAPDQAATMPVEGGFYFDGPAVRSTLEYTVQIESR